LDDRETQFLTSLLATYKIECEEHLSSLSQSLIELEANPPALHQQELLETIFRLAHSLKAASRSLNFTEVEKLCHSMEGALSVWKKGEITAAKGIFDAFYAAIDWLQAFIRQERLADPPSTTLIPLIQNFAKICKAANEQNGGMVIQTPQIREHSTTMASGAATTTMRVSVDKLDNLLQTAEELLLVKFMAAQNLQNFKTLSDLLVEYEQKWKNTPTHQSNDLKASTQWNNEDQWQNNFLAIFKKQLNQNISSAIHNDNFITHLVDTLLSDTKQLMMQPLSTILTIFPRMIRDLGQVVNKQVQWHVVGGEIEIDRRILEELKDPLTHLIRNSMDHGIESSDIRTQKNKTPQGTITISAAQTSGNSVEIAISDDGAGIDVNKIKEVALKEGKINPAKLQTLSSEQILELIFQSGVTTSKTITSVSGRGIGMGVVVDKVEKLGGKIAIENQPGLGVTFRIVLPLTLATFRGIYLNANREDFIIPILAVKKVLRLPTSDIQSLQGHQAITFEGRIIPYMHLSKLINIATDPTATLQAMQQILLIKAQNIVAAIGVDEIIGEQEVLVKNIGPQVMNIPNVLAMTIFESGRIVPILDAVALLQTFQETLQKLAEQHEMSTKDDQQQIIPAKTILMAEDSPTMQTVLQNILKSAGYNIIVADDGAQALTIIEKEPIDLLLSDVEMPNLNGFELVKIVRSQPKFDKLPIIFCTARGSDRDRSYGLQLGANAYIDKNYFVAQELLNTINELLNTYE